MFHDLIIRRHWWVE